MAGLAAAGQHAPQPEKMVEIGADQARKAQLEPALAGGDEDQTCHQQNARDQAEQGDLADPDRDECKQERKGRDHLRLVMEGVPNHCRGHPKHQDKVEGLVRQHPHRVDVIQREGDEKGERPAAADHRPREDAVLRAPLQQQTTNQQRQAEQHANRALAQRAHGPHPEAKQRGDTDDQRDDSEFVQPVAAEALLQRDGALWFGRLHSLRCCREWRHRYGSKRGRRRSGRRGNRWLRAHGSGWRRCRGRWRIVQRMAVDERSFGTRHRATLHPNRPGDGLRHRGRGRHNWRRSRSGRRCRLRRRCR